MDAVCGNQGPTEGKHPEIVAQVEKRKREKRYASRDPTQVK
jgi:hypothetical protein